MSDEVIIAICTSVTAIVAAYFAYKSKVQAEETHKAVNSRMTELLALAKSSSKAEGKLEGHAESGDASKPLAPTPPTP